MKKIFTALFFIATVFGLNTFDEKKITTKFLAKNKTVKKPDVRVEKRWL